MLAPIIEDGVRRKQPEARQRIVPQGNTGGVGAARSKDLGEKVGMGPGGRRVGGDGLKYLRAAKARNENPVWRGLDNRPEDGVPRLHDVLANVAAQKRQKFRIAGSDASVEMGRAHADIEQHRGPVAR